MKNTDRLLRRFGDVVAVMRAAPAHRFAPYIIGGVIGGILGPLLAVHASVAMGLAVLGAGAAILGVVWATEQAVKAASRRYGP